LSKVNEIKLMRRNVRRYAAQAIAPIDGEIGQKGLLWMETSYLLKLGIFNLNMCKGIQAGA
jgi:hypothetical protein